MFHKDHYVDHAQKELMKEAKKDVSIKHAMNDLLQDFLEIY